MSTKRRTKTTVHNPEEDQHDRFTLSVRKGYRAYLRMIADELNLDVSKLARLAIEDYIKANRTKLSEDILKMGEKLRRGHGPGRYDEML